MLPAAIARQLTSGADTAIQKVLAHGGARTKAPYDEVSAVRTMTLDGFDEIAAAWAPTLKFVGCRIDLRAVFCHSKPHVTFAAIPHPRYPGGRTPRVCELADLLIVVDHVDPYKKIDDRRAVLVQAKILKGGKIAPSRQEWVQHELLGWLPDFSFIDPRYDQRSRNLNGTPLVGTPHLTAEYGGIDLKTSPPIWHHWLTATATPWFHAALPLPSYLAGMVTGDTNCSREAVRGGLDDWSFTVDELLRVTSAIPITLTSGVPRGNDNVVGFIADTSNLAGTGDGGGAGGPEGDFVEWPEGPISTVHVTIRSIDDFEDERSLRKR